MSTIDALTPIDGRYDSKITELKEFFSEYALVKYRVYVEIQWLIALCEETGIPEARELSADEVATLEKIAAENIHELLRAWELKHRFLTSESVFHHTLFREETRWPGYYYRGDHMKVDDENWHVLTVSRRDPQTGEYTMEKAPLYHLVGDIEDKALAELKAKGNA